MTRWLPEISLKRNITLPSGCDLPVSALHVLENPEGRADSFYESYFTKSGEAAE